MCHVSTGSMHTNVLLSLSVWIKQLHWVSSLEQRDEPLVLHKGFGVGGGGGEQGRNCFRSRKESKKEVFCCGVGWGGGGGWSRGGIASGAERRARKKSFVVVHTSSWAHCVWKRLLLFCIVFWPLPCCVQVVTLGSEVGGQLCPPGLVTHQDQGQTRCCLPVDCGPSELCSHPFLSV